MVGVLMIGVDAGSFWSQMQGGVDVWLDVGNGVLKSIVFGFAVSFIALLQGYEAQPTPEGGPRHHAKRWWSGFTWLYWGWILCLTAMMFSI